jgi:hypothetical protein
MSLKEAGMRISAAGMSRKRAEYERKRCRYKSRWSEPEAGRRRMLPAGEDMG